MHHQVSLEAPCRGVRGWFTADGLTVDGSTLVITGAQLVSDSSEKGGITAPGTTPRNGGTQGLSLSPAREALFPLLRVPPPEGGQLH